MAKIFEDISLSRNNDTVLDGGYRFEDFDAAIDQGAFSKSVFCFCPEEDGYAVLHTFPSFFMVCSIIMVASPCFPATCWP